MRWKVRDSESEQTSTAAGQHEHFSSVPVAHNKHVKHAEDGGEAFLERQLLMGFCCLNKWLMLRKDEKREQWRDWKPRQGRGVDGCKQETLSGPHSSFYDEPTREWGVHRFTAQGFLTSRPWCPGWCVHHILVESSASSWSNNNAALKVDLSALHLSELCPLLHQLHNIWANMQSLCQFHGRWMWVAATHLYQHRWTDASSSRETEARTFSVQLFSLILQRSLSSS